MTRNDPEHNSADDAQPTREEWEEYERQRGAPEPPLPTPEEVREAFRELGADPFF